MRPSETVSLTLRSREPARGAVAGFVRLWLLDQDSWGPGAVERIDVRFADEAGPADVPPAGSGRGDL